ncbi:hypothetical protein RND61_27005 [Streptomyces sp. TRM76323]|uniref:Serine protease n=1 Tax=Streptomyces tamarix TaxID=3078565 RepID=A0ABU3QSA6_9ACTN|nr:hypothetical protein [Streptomyces tamarix]MDT9685688.1 hypothetical protein [Streptomyces tamarix]
MKKSTLRSAAAAAALATGLAAASVTTASAAPAPAPAPAPAASSADRPAVGRITTPEQLAESLRRAVEEEAGRGGVAAEGNVVGYLAPRSGTGTRPC